MLREIIIKVYLALFKCIFNVFSVFKIRENKTVVMSYLGFNSKFIVDELSKDEKKTIIVFKTEDTKVEFEGKNNVKIYDLTKNKIVNNIILIFNMATSKYIFVDNYYGFLASFKWKKGVKCVQLWHADGAIKKFGYKDKSNEKRTPSAIKRFGDVYDKFTHITIGGEKMSKIFQEAFGVEEKRIIRTGIPRTDLFFDQAEKNKIIDKLKKDYPIIKEKKVILYAPTFRDNEFNVNEINLDINLMKEKLKDEYILILKLHPLIKSEVGSKYGEFVLDLSDYKNINDLLMIADILISDYSSVPFEFSLLNKPTLFYAYDLEEYKENRGIWGEYQELVGNLVVYNTEDLIKLITTDINSMENEIVEFNKKWNGYNDGNSTKKVIDKIYNEN